MTGSPFRPPRASGFSLLEMSLVLLILALLAGGLLEALTPRQMAQATSATQRQLADANEALLGFAIRAGRLPCPAKPTLAEGIPGVGEEDCTLQHGVLPWVTLALPAQDAWGRRFTYYASNRFTSPLPENANASFAIDTAGNAIVRNRQGLSIASDLPMILLSHGPNGRGAYLPDGSRLPASGDEAENADADINFVDATLATDFDDLVTWIPPGILKNRLVSAGRLP